DRPETPNAYGAPGWTQDDEWFLVYDRYDIWATDPSGRRAPRNVTEGVGRAQGLRFRYVRLDREQDAIDPRAPILLAAFDTRTKAPASSPTRAEGKAGRDGRTPGTQRSRRPAGRRTGGVRS